jgi:hypothetical protein
VASAEAGGAAVGGIGFEENRFTKEATMKRRNFSITGFDEDGVRGNPDNLRLVCAAGSGGKVAVWGTHNSRRNIDAVLAAGPHCTFDAEWIDPPDDFERKFGHRYWVPEHADLIVTS